MKFRQLAEYNIKIFLLKNNLQNVVEKVVSHPFIKFKTEHISALVV